MVVVLTSDCYTVQYQLTANGSHSSIILPRLHGELGAAQKKPVCARGGKPKVYAVLLVKGA